MQETRDELLRSSWDGPICSTEAVNVLNLPLSRVDGINWQTLLEDVNLAHMLHVVGQLIEFLG